MMDMFDLFVVVYAGLTGLLVASFLNVAVYRLPHGETIVRGHSHCMSCGHALGTLDLVPVLSYLLLGRRCRYCRAPISGRYMTVELAGGVYFTLSALARRPFSGPAALVPLLVACALFCLLLVDSLIRFDGHERVPSGPAMAAFALAALAALAGMFGLTGQATTPTDMVLRLAGLAIGLLAVPTASRVLRPSRPLPAINALPVAGLVLGLPAMLAVLLPVLALLFAAAAPQRANAESSANAAPSDNANSPAGAVSAVQAGGIATRTSMASRIAPLAGFILYAAMSLLNI